MPTLSTCLSNRLTKPVLPLLPQYPIDNEALGGTSNPSSIAGGSVNANWRKC